MPNVQPPVPSPHTLILASNSPRRRELLAEAGYRFVVVPPHADVECGVCSESGPAGLVAELAYRKAKAVCERLRQKPGDLGLQNSDAGLSIDLTQPLAVAYRQSPIVLAADTVAECDGLILGKPGDEEAARAMLRQLSGCEHRVLTGVCLWRLSLPLPLGEGRGEGAPPHEGAPPRPFAQRVRPDLLRFARTLRQSQTTPEQFMWRLVRNRRFGGFKFRRQYPLDPYVLDFYCHDRLLAIELDGGQHNTDEGRRTDIRRSRYIADRGIRVLRFWNHEVFQDTDTVLEAIWKALHRGRHDDSPGGRSQVSGSLTPNPSPRERGEPDSPPLPLGEGRGEGLPLIRVAVTKLQMDPLSDSQLEEYLASGQWEGKAGAFGYQDRLGWVHVVEGSESNVVGLPMELLAEMLQQLDEQRPPTQFHLPNSNQKFDLPIPGENATVEL